MKKDNIQNIFNQEKYSLVICEKTDAARKIASSLSNNKYKVVKIFNTTIFIVKYEGKNYVLCSAMGHLYNIKLIRRQKLPAYEYAWVSLDQIDKKKSSIVKSKIRAIEALSKDTNEFILACDLDQEGETIGYNILKYACGEKQYIAKRVKFSTLIENDIKIAFSNIQKNINIELAIAGRTRHAIDFLYGINISKALTKSFMTASNKYRTLSIGRVQGPTISYVVENDLEIQTHVPIPFWSVNAHIESHKTDKTKWIKIHYIKSKIITKRNTKNIIKECKGKQAIVSKIKKEKVRIYPPIPLNLIELQKEAFRLYKFNPYQTLTLAEKLYLKALISYPRTNSQKLPTQLNFRNIILNLNKLSEFKNITKNLIEKPQLIPTQGKETDTAHPSIYPTGKSNIDSLTIPEKKLFILIARRFLNVFRDTIIKEKMTTYFKIGKHEFCYSPNSINHEVESGQNIDDKSDLNAYIGKIFNVKRIYVVKKFENPPRPFNQMTLVQKMESEKIGTKSTRANIIHTIINRDYIKESQLIPTPLAKALVEILHNYSSGILSSEMTRKIEEQLSGIEEKKITQEQVLEKTKKDVNKVVKNINENKATIGKYLERAVKNLVVNESTNKSLGKCTICQKGDLIITSNTRNRALICSNSKKNDCIVKASLPRFGYIRVNKTGCNECSWPKVRTSFKGKPWSFCLNPECNKAGKRK